MRVWSCIVTVAILGCAPVADPQLPPGGVSLDETEQLLKSQYTQLVRRERLVIRDAQTWSEFWDQAHGQVSPQPSVPSIDFSRNIVVAATMGSRPSGGYNIEIDQVYDVDGAVYVIVTERSAGPGCITTQAVTAPASAVRVPRPGASVTFIERSETFPC